MSSYRYYSGTVNTPSSININITPCEINLRDELYKIFHGTSENYAHASSYILRKARRDTDGTILPCQCQKDYAGEGDYSCIYCNGLGYYFDDVAILGYKASGSLANETFGYAGQFTSDTKFFYFLYNEIITKKDFIIEPYFENDGSISSPFKIKYFWDIQDVNKFRSDDLGRVEYIKCLVKLRPEGKED